MLNLGESGDVGVELQHTVYFFSRPIATPTIDSVTVETIKNTVLPIHSDFFVKSNARQGSREGEMY